MIIGEYNDVYPPTLDGVGTVVKSYCESLTELGHECYYIAPKDPNYTGTDNFKTLLFNGIKMPSTPYHLGMPLLDPRFLLVERKIAFDIVHAHSPFTAGLEARRRSGLSKVPLVATFHSKYYDDFYEKTQSKTLASIGTNLVVNFYNQCDEVWTVNEMTADVLHSYGYKKDIFIMPNGTNVQDVVPEDIDVVNSAYSISPDEIILLFVGQMNWKKNLRRILEGFALFAKTNPGRLVMAGQGPDEKEIIDCANELGISERMIFTGHISERAKILALFARADVFVFPSIYDNAPMVVREAASVGTPSILMRNTCASEGITDGVNGILCEDTNLSLSDSIVRALKDKKVLGEQAKKTIPIAWSGIAEKIIERYQYLIDLKSKA